MPAFVPLRALRVALSVALLVFAQLALAGAREIRTIVLTVSDVERAAVFYEEALGFERVAEHVIVDPGYRKMLGATGEAVRNVVLRLGTETIELESHDGATGRPIPADSRSNDLWFQHFAIVVSDMDRAYDRLRRFAFEPISTAPQTIPPSNAAAAGVRAYKFKDPDGHPLELLYFPPGKGASRWQSADGLFLGIDHSAITVSSTEASLAFYRDVLGFAVAGGGVNTGATQAALDAVPNPVVRITGLRPRSPAGPGLEFLQYVEPGAGRPAPAVRPEDLAHVRLVIEVDEVDALLAKLPPRAVRAAPPGFRQTGGRSPRAALVADPDGHALLLVGDAPGAGSAPTEPSHRAAGER